MNEIIGGNLPPGHHALLFSHVQVARDMPIQSHICKIMDHWGKSKCSGTRYRFEPSTCRSTVEHANHQTTMTAPSRRIPGSSTSGAVITDDPPPMVVCDNSTATCIGHPHAGGGAGRKGRIEEGKTFSGNLTLAMHIAYC